MNIFLTMIQRMLILIKLWHCCRSDIDRCVLTLSSSFALVFTHLFKCILLMWWSLLVNGQHKDDQLGVKYEAQKNKRH